MDGYTLSISTTVAISTLHFLAGLLVGHRMALRRDKRKEFNTIVEPIIPKLLRERESPSALFTAISSTDEYLIASMLPKLKQARFKRTCAAYHKAKSENQVARDHGGIGYNNPTEIIKHIDTLLNYLNRK